MKKLLLAITLATGLTTSNTSFAEPLTAAVVGGVIANADGILNGINPQTGKIIDNNDMWCIANEWQTRDTMVKQKGLPESVKFSRETQVFGLFKGATWFCYAKI